MVIQSENNRHFFGFSSQPIIFLKWYKTFNEITPNKGQGSFFNFHFFLPKKCIDCQKRDVPFFERNIFGDMVHEFWEPFKMELLECYFEFFHSFCLLG